MLTFLIFFFFFKQKTAYEMRISDWSSDVCSSDLQTFRRSRERPAFSESGQIAEMLQIHVRRLSIPFRIATLFAKDNRSNEQGRRAFPVWRLLSPVELACVVLDQATWISADRGNRKNVV